MKGIHITFSPKAICQIDKRFRTKGDPLNTPILGRCVNGHSYEVRLILQPNFLDCINGHSVKMMHKKRAALLRLFLHL